MNTKQIYFKSDFTVILASEAQWGGAPFRLSFFTASPSRAFVACFDGENYTNCRLLEDGRLEVAINQKNGTVQSLMGIGTLQVSSEFYLNNQAFADHVCNEFVRPFEVVCEDEDGTEYNIRMDLNGSSTLTTIGTLPAFYQKGDKGDAFTYDDFTEEEIEGLKRPAKEAADKARMVVGELTEASNAATKKANDAADNADAKAAEAAQKAAAAQAAKEAADAATLNANMAKAAADAATAAANAAKDAANAAAQNASDKAAAANAARVATEAATAAANAAKDAALAAKEATEAAIRGAEAATAAANTEAGSANTAAANANTKADAANTAAQAAQAAKDAAMAAKNAADTAAQAANDAAAAAQEAAQTIDTKIGDTRNRVLDVEKDFGKYVQRPDVTLEVVQTGKRFTKDGEMVADANWNIGRIGSVERGLLYELFMGGSDKMVLGTALFVSHTVEKRGSADVDIYTPVFSALGTDLPVSNYAVLWAGENYSDLLVSYRADVAGANVMRVAEWGLFKSIATQYANLKAQVNLKSFADGYYAGMRVGTADNLTPRGEASEEMFRERVAGGTNEIEDGAASIRSIKGKTVKMAQLIKNGNFADGVTNWGSRQSGALVVENNTAKLLMKVTGNNNSMYQDFTNELIVGHKLLFCIKYKGEGFSSLRLLGAAEESYSTKQTFLSSISPSDTEKSVTMFREVSYTGIKRVLIQLFGVEEAGGICEIYEFRMYDLTAMFGAGNEPDSEMTFAEALSYQSIDEIPYSNSKLIPSKVEGVKTTGRNLITEQISDEILEATGWVKNAGGSYQGYLTYLKKLDDNKGGLFKEAINGWNGQMAISLAYEYPGDTAALYLGFHYSDGTTSRGQFMLQKGIAQHVSAEGKIVVAVHITYSASRQIILSDIMLEKGAEAHSYEPYDEHERKWTDTIRKYFPDGLKSAGDVYDEMTSTKAIKRVGVRPYEAGDETNANVVTDGVISYYALAEQEEYPYDELNLTEIVFAGGMEIAIVPEGEESAPLVADIVYPIDAYNTIKANKAKIEALQQKPAISLTADEVTKLRALISTATQSEGGEL